MAPGASRKVCRGSDAQCVMLQHSCGMIVPDAHESTAETHDSHSNLMGILGAKRMAGG